MTQHKSSALKSPVFWVVILGLIGFCMWGTYVQLQFDWYGKTTTGKITNCYTEKVRGIVYRLSYQYTVDGISYSGDQRVHYSMWETVHRGSTIPVTFIPSEPQRSQVDSYTKDYAGGLAFSVFASIVLIGLVLIHEREKQT